jgi:hypothetical protein
VLSYQRDSRQRILGQGVEQSLARLLTNSAAPPPETCWRRGLCMARDDSLPRSLNKPSVLGGGPPGSLADSKSTNVFAAGAAVNVVFLFTSLARVGHRRIARRASCVSRTPCTCRTTLPSLVLHPHRVLRQLCCNSVGYMPEIGLQLRLHIIVPFQVHTTT